MSKKYRLEELPQLYKKLKDEISRIFIGQDEIVENILIALLSGGHVLIEGVPGLGKTLLASTLAMVVNGDYKRIQFTPDLMPSDIIGTSIYMGETSTFKVKKGPVFCNVLLADEVNRSPAKTQSALLQAMQEKEVTVDGEDYKLDDFFICLATQNPIEMEGTYPLPEAQIDRFFMKLNIGYPELLSERAMLKNYRAGFSHTKLEEQNIQALISKDDLQEISKTIESVTVEDNIIDYITNIVTRTRSYNGIEVGSSPRGSVDLLKASRVLAAVSGRTYVIPEDVKDIAYPVLRHRIILEVEAEIDGISPDDTLKSILNEVEVPR